MTKNTSGILTLIFVVGIVSAAFWRTHDLNVKQDIRIEQVLTEERRVTCPALLSIARTPRDTLIVMKNKPVCVQYVFENLD